MKTPGSKGSEDRKKIAAWIGFVLIASALAACGIAMTHLL